MVIDWVTFLVLLDYLAFLIVLTVFIGSRFNTWPTNRKTMLSGLPRDYIDPKRYRLFYIIYLATYVIIIFSLLNMPLLVPLAALSGVLSDEVLEVLARLQTKEMPFVWTSSIMVAAVLLRRKSIESGDDFWRGQLLEWARIPRAVEELRAHLCRTDSPLAMSQKSVDHYLSKLVNPGVRHFWQEQLQRWGSQPWEDAQSWRFLEVLFLLGTIRDSGLMVLNAEDRQRYEVRLRELAALIADAADQQERRALYLDELNGLMDSLLEQVCKYVVKAHGSEADRYEALKGFGFEASGIDSPSVNYLEMVCLCLGAITLTCGLTISVYLWSLDWSGVTPPWGSEAWLESRRLVRWTTANLVSYGFIIFLSAMVEKLATAKSALPGIGAYAIALVLSTLCAFVYFLIDRGFHYLPQVVLALSLGMSSVVVVKALSKETCASGKEVVRSAAVHGALFGLVTGVLQVLVSAAYRSGFASDPGVLIDTNLLGFAYGYVKGFGVAFAISYTIQESLRRHLLASGRRHRRARFRSPLRAFKEGSPIRLISRKISRSGVMVENRSGVLKSGDRLDLDFSFGKVTAVVRWAQGHFAGLEFDRDDGSLARLRDYISRQFGVRYA